MLLLSSFCRGIHEVGPWVEGRGLWVSLMSARKAGLSKSLFRNIYIYISFLCRDRQCGTRSHPAGANPSGGSQENGGIQGEAKAASEEGQELRALWEEPSQLGCPCPLSPLVPQPLPCPPGPGSPGLLPTCCNHAGELCGNPRLPSSRCHVLSFRVLWGWRQQGLPPAMPALARSVFKVHM